MFLFLLLTTPIATEAVAVSNGFIIYILAVFYRAPAPGEAALAI